MHKSPRTHYLLADGGHARLVTRPPGAADLSTIAEVKDGGHITGKPGATVHQRHGAARSSSRDEKAGARHLADFAAQAADLVKEADFDRLVLVAPGRMLSALRDSLSKAARTRLVGELARDLTKTPDHDLSRWLHAL